mgnify:CR=1 FL=1
MHLFAASGLPDRTLYTSITSDTGKPALQLADGQVIAYSHARVRAEGRVAIVHALCRSHEVGLDAEIWANAALDETFLESIRCQEDARTIGLLRHTGRDVATALWVIKEAALKWSGDIMRDPRHVSVTPFSSNRFAIDASTEAGSPVPACHVDVFIASLPDFPTHIPLIAVAHALQGSTDMNVSSLHFGIEPLRLGLSLR